MKKYLLCVMLLVLSAASFRTAGAVKVCGGSSGGYTLSGGKLTFDSDCTEIGNSAFKNNKSIVSVDLSNTSVTKFELAAFEGCSLTSIKFPASLKHVMDNAFYQCTSLTSVDFSNTSLISIAGDAFMGCTSLTSVKVPASLTSIWAEAFMGCSSLASVDLSNNSLLATIGSGSFANLKKPSTITVTKGSQAHKLLGGSKGTSAVTGDPIGFKYGNNYTTLIVKDAPTPTPTPDPSKPTPTSDPLDPTPLPSTPTPTPEPGTASGAVEVIRVVPLPEDEFGSYELDPVTGEKNYLMFHTYDICMNFLNDDALCSGYERCYHK